MSRARHLVSAFGVAAVAGALALFPATAASAHAQRHQGDIDMEIGFGTEPAYAGQLNSAQILLNFKGKPVVDLGDTLTAEISFGGESTKLPVVPAFEVGDSGEPGDYRAWFIPSQPGKYTFHFTGTVNGEPLDQTVTSGPTTFDEAGDTSDITFPAVNAPSAGELATRIDREGARTDAAIQTAASRASDARSVGWIGVTLGAIGVIAAIASMARRRGRGPDQEMNQGMKGSTS